MESLNNLHLPSTIKKPENSKRLQERLLSQLSDSLQNRTNRPRNTLSKFTITSPRHFPSCEDHIPAYRTYAQESLPIVSLSHEDNKKLNVSSVSGMPYYISSHTRRAANQARLNSSTSDSDLKTRKCLLQKKTIHRSLEDLGNKSGKVNHLFDVIPSSRLRKRKSIPTCLSVAPSSLQQRHKQNEDYEKKRSEIERLTETSQFAQKKLNPEIPTDNIISTTEKERSYNISHSCGPGGDFAVSVSNNTNDEEMDLERRNLSIENELLKKRIKEERRKCIFYRVVSAFIFEALRRRSNALIEVEQNLRQRREECAARIILHHLLLNSWRMTKGQAAAIAVENAQMHKTIDNQSLQLNVIRKMQSIEKDKTTSVLNDYSEVKRNYCQMIKENECMKEEYAKVLEEKRSLERHLRNLSDENSRLNTDLQLRLDKKEMQLKSMELDRFRAEKFSKENEQLVKEAELARIQIKELTTQQVHWQERALSYESRCYELKQEIESKEKAYERVLCDKRDISRENEILTLSKSNLEKAVEEAQLKLIESTKQKKQLEQSYNECKEELEDLEDQVEYLQSALKQYKKENIEIRQKLYDCTLKNVKRRRVWGAALYFLVNPIEAFKRLYFGQTETRPSNDISRLRLSAREKSSEENVGC